MPVTFDALTELATELGFCDRVHMVAFADASASAGGVVLEAATFPQCMHDLPTRDGRAYLTVTRFHSPAHASFTVDALIAWAAVTPTRDDPDTYFAFLRTFGDITAPLANSLLFMHFRRAVLAHAKTTPKPAPEDGEGLRAWLHAMPGWPHLHEADLMQRAHMLLHGTQPTTGDTMKQAEERHQRNLRNMDEADEQLDAANRQCYGTRLLNTAYRAELAEARAAHLSTLEQEIASMRISIAEEAK